MATPPTTPLTVNDQQAAFISSASTPIVVVDTQGQMLGHIMPVALPSSPQPTISEKQLAEIKRRMQTPGPGLTTQEILVHLHSLDKA